MSRAQRPYSGPPSAGRRGAHRGRHGKNQASALPAPRAHWPRLPARTPPAPINTSAPRASPHSSLVTRVAPPRHRSLYSTQCSCLVSLTMKAITAVCATGASVPAIASGRVHRHRDGENAEIQMYLSKLQDLVPFMPKNRKISKLEVIQHVIDYICDLQSALENHPAMDQFDAEGALAAPPCVAPQPRPARRPLGPRAAPNTILHQQTSSQEHRNQMTPEKQNQPDRPAC